MHMFEGVTFRDYEDRDAPVMPGLFLRAIQDIYPDLSDGRWLDGLRDIKGTYLETGGAFKVGEQNGLVIAMAGLKRVSDTTGEMIRVAVEPNIHSRGIGRSIVGCVETKALGLGVSKMILDTTIKQEAARHIYETSGYVRYRRQKVEHASGHVFDTLYYRKALVT